MAGPLPVGDLGNKTADVARGVVKGAVDTPYTILNATENIKNSAAPFVGGKNQQTSYFQQKPEALQPHGTGENLGYYGEQAAELFIGLEVKVLKIAEKTAGLVKVERLVKATEETIQAAKIEWSAAKGVKTAEQVTKVEETIKDSAKTARIANAGNYRKLFLEEVPNMPREYEVHHTLPQKYEELMARNGVNIHEIKYLRGGDIETHQKITQEWRIWEKRLGRALTAQEVLNFARRIENKYKGNFIRP